MSPKAEILPFSLEIRPGVAVFEQLVFAVKKALVARLIKPGDRFPSVRTISRELRIHPNTVQKAITALVGEGLLDVHPGIGTVVRESRALPARESLRVLADDIERLIVEARKMGLQVEDLQNFLTAKWNELSAP